MRCNDVLLVWIEDRRVTVATYLEGKYEAKGLGGLWCFRPLQEVMVLRATDEEMKSSLSLDGIPILLTITSSWC